MGGGSGRSAKVTIGGGGGVDDHTPRNANFEHFVTIPLKQGFIEKWTKMKDDIFAILQSTSVSIIKFPMNYMYICTLYFCCNKSTIIFI